jgi:glycine cleavage system aminomethyltransferase T
MAEWLVDGKSTTFDLHECELGRFEPHQLSPEFIKGKDIQNYLEVYDIKHPLQPMEDPRPLRVSPFYARQQELGAAFLEGAGWERPHWFESNASLLADRDIPAFHGWSAQYWNPIVAAEAQHTREAVALFDMTPLKRLEVVGPDAESLLQGMTTGNVTRSVGSVTYCLLLDQEGGIRSDVTVARLGENHYQVGANGNSDLQWLQRHSGDSRVTIRDITPGTCCLGLWGPRARDVISGILSDIDFTAEAFRYFRAKQGFVGNVPVTALRVSYVGELGWELYTTADMGLKLWDTLWAAGQDHGLVAAGRGALNSLRLEKGYRAFGTDMTFEHNPYEAGLGFAVKLDTDFVGRNALVERQDEVTRRLACLTYDDAEVLLGREPVLDNGNAVGYITSAAYGYTIGRGIAYAWLPVALAEPGQELQIQNFDGFVTATVNAEPLFDPDMRRVRS